MEGAQPTLQETMFDTLPGGDMRDEARYRACLGQGWKAESETLMESFVDVPSELQQLVRPDPST